MIEELNIYSDGGARGNPGPSGTGVVIETVEGKRLYEKGEFIGVGTNNKAEYTALIKALKLADLYGAKSLNCYLDSELVVKQLKGEYKVKNPALKSLHKQVRTLEEGFSSVEYFHVKREHEKIKIADRLVNQAIDER